MFERRLVLVTEIKKMALTEFQIKILRLLADDRKSNGESYVAGGLALNKILEGSRLSHDVDLFHDTSEALAVSWASDKKLLNSNNYVVEIIREAPTFVEALVSKDNDSLIIQWVRDSAFRFFPLIEDDVLGLTMHPFDLATNKILALAGRLEPRDWVDTINSINKLQPLGYLIWSACGKDPGINPDMLLDDASRLHYSQSEIDTLIFEKEHPDAKALSIQWKNAVKEAINIINQLPEDHLGECVINRDGSLYQQKAEKIQSHKIHFHKGSIGGIWPNVKT